jgi:hypothetical protein
VVAAHPSGFPPDFEHAIGGDLEPSLFQALVRVCEDGDIDGGAVSLSHAPHLARLAEGEYLALHNQPGRASVDVELNHW